MTCYRRSRESQMILAFFARTGKMKWQIAQMGTGTGRELRKTSDAQHAAWHVVGARSMFVGEKGRGRGEQKEGVSFSLGCWSLRFLSIKPSCTHPLLFHNPHLTPGARAVIIIKRLLGHKGSGRRTQLEQDPSFSNGFGARKHCFLPSNGAEHTQLSFLVSEQYASKLLFVWQIHSRSMSH